MSACHFHRDRRAVAACAGCGHLLCAGCQGERVAASALCPACVTTAREPQGPWGPLQPVPEALPHSAIVSTLPDGPPAGASPAEDDSDTPFASRLRERREHATQAASLGGTLTLQGAILLLVSVPVLMAGSATGTIAFGAAGFISIGAGLHYLFSSRRAQEDATRAESELRMLQLAAAHGHVLTATQAAAAIGLSVAETSRMLDQLAIEGHIEIGNDPGDGTIVYSFPSPPSVPRPNARAVHHEEPVPQL